MEIDKNAIREHVRGILEALGEDPDREGLKDTPERVARMYEEVFEGIKYSNHEIAEMFNRTFSLKAEGIEKPVNGGVSNDYYDMGFPAGGESGDCVIVRDIEVFSYCEHHMALMYDMKVTVAYVPRDRVIGLSKIARIADMVSKRLQLQERIGADIAEIMEEVTGSPDVGVLIEGKHSCMSARGIRKERTVTVTRTLRGRFKTDPVLAAVL